MIEAEWRECSNPHEMLSAVKGQVSERKLRLFACACIRAVPEFFLVDQYRRIVDLAEKVADGRIHSDTMLTVRDAHWPRPSAFLGDWLSAQAAVRATTSAYGWSAAVNAALASARIASLLCVDRTIGKTQATLWDHETARQVEYQRQCRLLRDILGDPWQSVPETHAWQQGASATVMSMAETIYRERTFEDLPILADALEEAGYDNEPVLAHYRGPHDHTLGCWALDNLLGKT